jgi:protein-ribulosamine 3-kinase
MQQDHTLIDSISKGLFRTTGKLTDLKWVRDLHGGDINHAALIRSGATQWFLKYHQNAPKGMFAAEAQALAEISAQSCIKAPAPVAHGNDGNTGWLVLEYLDIKPVGPEDLLGQQLAQLHGVIHKQHGWSNNNYIGTSIQHNSYHDDWSTFWRDQRLKPQLAMTEASGHSSRLLQLGEQLLDSIDQLLDGHRPAASLLHGDLWAGNKAFTRDGQAVIFDPATYYGDRETDIAMTELFGGFGPSFYSAYQEHSPLPDGYELRRDLYNLYHMLNHLNLFGGAYAARCENMISGLLAQLR